MLILAIESSCDETGVAIIKDGQEILAQTLRSQMKTHAKYGGVVPELASRMHTEAIHTLIDSALEEAKLSINDIDRIAVTQGPGLEGALLIGMTVAKTLSYLKNIPLIPVNHLHGHIYASYLEAPTPQFPYVCLIVSGGHTQLLRLNNHDDIQLLGQTRDDAAGEAFDKVARALELGYPGGPAIQNCAENGKDTAFDFPKAMIKSGYEFSFSGLKTAVIQCIQTFKKDNKELPTANIAASFQKTVVDILVAKTIIACEKNNIKEVVVSGGVAANAALKIAMKALEKSHGYTVHIPSLKHCTDNAAMIGAAAFYKGETVKNIDSISVKSNLSL